MSYSHWYICVVSLCQFIVLSGSSMTTELATRPGGYKLICIFCSFNKIKSSHVFPNLTLLSRFKSQINFVVCINSLDCTALSLLNIYSMQ